MDGNSAQLGQEPQDGHGHTVKKEFLLGGETCDPKHLIECIPGLDQINPNKSCGVSHIRRRGAEQSGLPQGPYLINSRVRWYNTVRQLKKNRH